MDVTAPVLRDKAACKASDAAAPVILLIRDGAQADRTFFPLHQRREPAEIPAPPLPAQGHAI